MSLFSDALDRLKKYNLGPFSLASNPFGLTGAGGPDTNFEPMLGDVVTASQATADNATTAAGSATAAAGSAGAAAGSASAAAGSATLADQNASAAGGAIPAVRLTWDTATADADPGNGKVRFNSATAAAATALYVDNVDVAGAAITTILDRWTASTNTVKGTLRIAHRTDATKWLEYQVGGVVVDGTGYRKFAVTGGAGPGGFAAGDPVAVGFSRAGDKGADGTNGSGAIWAGTSSGSANAQTLTPATPLPNLTGNPSYEFVAGFSITGAATLAVSATGALSLRRTDGTPASKGDVIAGTKYVVTLVSGQWRLSASGMTTAQAHALAASFL